jgi:hypothetical protein
MSSAVHRWIRFNHTGCLRNLFIGGRIKKNEKRSAKTRTYGGAER